MEAFNFSSGTVELEPSSLLGPSPLLEFLLGGNRLIRHLRIDDFLRCSEAVQTLVQHGIQVVDLEVNMRDYCSGEARQLACFLEWARRLLPVGGTIDLNGRFLWDVGPVTDSELDPTTVYLNGRRYDSTDESSWPVEVLLQPEDAFFRFAVLWMQRTFRRKRRAARLIRRAWFKVADDPYHKMGAGRLKARFERWTGSGE